MPTTSFENITNRLDINPATIDTTYDKTRQKGRAITKIPYIFYIPALPTISVPYQGVIVYQANYTATSRFKIINTGTGYTDLQPKVFVCIKYRVGGTVYRYRLPVSSSTITLDLVENLYLNSIQCPKYAQQIIEPNFTLEWWSGTPFGGDAGGVFYPTYEVVTNRLVNPDYPEETFRIIAENPEILTRADLIKTFPEIIPTVYPSGSSWLTN